MASSAKIKEDTNILRNIKKREVLNAIKQNGKSLSLSGIGASERNFHSNTKKTYDMLPEKAGKAGSPQWKDSQFIAELLDWHNLLRARHGVRQLQLDYKLCQMAQNWANFLAHTNEFHYQNPKEVRSKEFIFSRESDLLSASTERTSCCGRCPSCRRPRWPPSART